MLATALSSSSTCKSARVRSPVTRGSRKRNLQPMDIRLRAGGTIVSPGRTQSPAFTSLSLFCVRICVLAFGLYDESRTDLGARLNSTTLCGWITAQMAGSRTGSIICEDLYIMQARHGDLWIMSRLKQSNLAIKRSVCYRRGLEHRKANLELTSKS